MISFVRDIQAAVILLTRLPAGPTGDKAPDLSRSVWAYPLVGALIGGICGAAYWFATAVGLPAMIAAGIAIAVGLFPTGAFHEDGLADTADGFGGGATPERKLEIMRDSRIGTYGVVAIVVSVGLRWTAIANIGDPAQTIAILIAVGSLSRVTIFGLLLMPPARKDGMGVVARNPPPVALAAGVSIGLAVSYFSVGSTATIVFALIVFIVTLGMGTLAHRHVRGYTGDILGAGQQTSETVILVAAVALTL